MTPRRNDIPAPEHPDAPKYWRYETSGALALAVRVYLEFLRKSAKALRTPGEIGAWIRRALADGIDPL